MDINEALDAMQQVGDAVVGGPYKFGNRMALSIGGLIDASSTPAIIGSSGCTAHFEYKDGVLRQLISTAWYDADDYPLDIDRGDCYD